MRRPQSAKPGYKGYWGQGSESEFQDQQNQSKGAYRKNVKLMKPDLTTNDFARILPKKIYQDKQRLYSQALQLKQNLNQTLEQNIRLKTRVTILQKQKDKLTKHIEANRQNPGLNKANSRVNIYPVKSGQKDNMMIRNLKKMIRQGKQQNEFLKQQNAKIKKAIKYTKINELQIQRKMLQDENKRMVVLLQEMNSQLVNQDSCERDISDLKRNINYLQQANRQIQEQNLKSTQVIQQLNQKLNLQMEKAQNKQNKLQRQLALNKRKLNQSIKQTEDLKKQLNNFKLQTTTAKSQSNVFKPQSITTKNDTQKPKLTRPMSSNPYKSQSMVGVRLVTQNKKQEQNKQNQQIKNIQLQNQQLKQQLTRAKLKIQQTQRQTKKQKQSISQRQQQKNIDSKQNETNKEVKSKPKNQNSSVSNIINEKSKDNKNLIQQVAKNQYEDEKDDYADNYENQFDQNENNSHGVNDSPQTDKKSVAKQTKQIDQYRKDFEAEQQQQPLYIKQDSPKKKKVGQQKKLTQQNKKQKSQRSKKDLKQDNGKKKKDKKQTGVFKPDKKLLSQIKQLLTYRMKAQRYQYDELKRDIQEAKQKQFSLSDLKGMFINQPFYLTPHYTDVLIQYCFEKQTPKEKQILSNEVLLSKLRKVIDQFTLIQEKQEEDMLLRIAEMVTEYPEELQTAFQKIKNGQQTVAKQNLIQMFQNLELQRKYIELIIQQLSLCSTDLQHLNFIGFFQRFYVENISGLQNGQIDQQQMESSSQQVSKNLKSKDTKKTKQIKAEFEDYDQDLAVDDGQKISLGNQQKNYHDDDAEMISDDGPI